MLKTKRYLIFLMFASLVGILASCTYDFIEYPYVAPPDPEDTISFSLQIEPIFNAGDKCTSCHKAGGLGKGDLTTGAAYNTIVPALINTAVPEESLIYWHTHPNSDVHMQKKLSVSEADLILFWIKKGALNN